MAEKISGADDEDVMAQLDELIEAELGMPSIPETVKVQEELPVLPDVPVADIPSSSEKSKVKDRAKEEMVPA